MVVPKFSSRDKLLQETRRALRNGRTLCLLLREEMAVNRRGSGDYFMQTLDWQISGHLQMGTGIGETDRDSLQTAT